MSKAVIFNYFIILLEKKLFQAMELFNIHSKLLGNLIEQLTFYVYFDLVSENPLSI